MEENIIVHLVGENHHDDNNTWENEAEKLARQHKIVFIKEGDNFEAT